MHSGCIHDALRSNQGPISVKSVCNQCAITATRGSFASSSRRSNQGAITVQSPSRVDPLRAHRGDPCRGCLPQSGSRRGSRSSAFAPRWRREHGIPVGKWRRRRGEHFRAALATRAWHVWSTGVMPDDEAHEWQSSTIKGNQGRSHLEHGGDARAAGDEADCVEELLLPRGRVRERRERVGIHTAIHSALRLQDVRVEDVPNVGGRQPGTISMQSGRPSACKEGEAARDHPWPSVAIRGHQRPIWARTGQTVP